MTEVIRLPMICVCENTEVTTERHDKADALREQAKKLMTWNPKYPVDDRNFTSAVVSHLYGSFSAELEVAADQWFGAYTTVKKYVSCDHFDESKITKDTTEADIKAMSAACPGEPECFIYRWDDVLKVTVECDRLEDGLAALVVWFYENRKQNDD